jgi:hypothetical protein
VARIRSITAEETVYTDEELIKICEGLQEEINKDTDFKDTFMRFKVDLLAETTPVYYEGLRTLIQEFSEKASLASVRASDLLASMRKLHSLMTSTSHK